MRRERVREREGRDVYVRKDSDRLYNAMLIGTEAGARPRMKRRRRRAADISCVSWRRRWWCAASPRRQTRLGRGPVVGERWQFGYPKMANSTFSVIDWGERDM
jgi:hypothetical protein